MAGLLRQPEFSLLLFFAGMVLVNWPFLALRDRPNHEIFYYFFTIWALLILLLLLMAGSRVHPPAPDDRPEEK